MNEFKLDHCLTRKNNELLIYTFKKNRKVSQTLFLSYNNRLFAKIKLSQNERSF